MTGRGTVMADPRGYLTEEQVNSLLGACENKRDRALFQVMYRCGRRVSEVLALRKNHILWEEKRILFRILKKRHFHEEIKPVDEETLAILKDYVMGDNSGEPWHMKNMEVTDDGLLFPVTRQYVFKLIRKLGIKSGITTVGRKGLHPHHLRHSFAVHQVKRGNVKNIEQLRMLQRYMGHTDIGMTAHYLQFSTDDLKGIPDMWDKGSLHKEEVNLNLKQDKKDK